MSEAYNELYAYTMGHGGNLFVLQHVVDAHAAQVADEKTKPIGITFALIGLYLHVEQGFSGRQVQQVHMQLGRTKRSWPTIALPKDRGKITASDVLAAPAGIERDAGIDDGANPSGRHTAVSGLRLSNWFGSQELRAYERASIGLCATALPR